MSVPMRHRATCAVVLLLAVALPLRAARSADEAEDILAKVKRKYDSIRDAELKFTQHVRMAVAKVEQRVDGVLQLKKEHKYRVEMRDQTIVTDGSTRKCCFTKYLYYTAISGHELLKGRLSYYDVDEEYMFSTCMSACCHGYGICL